MWKTRGIRSWGEGWWDMPLTVGDQVGRIIGAPPGTICMHQNVTVAVAVVLSCFRLEPPRNRIVYVEGEFPSVRYLLQAQPGAEIEVVPDLDALVEAIDERTLLVPLSHVLFKTAELQDVDGGPAARGGGRRARPPRRVPVGRRGAGRRRPRSASRSRPAARSSGSAAARAPAGCTCGRT